MNRVQSREEIEMGYHDDRDYWRDQDLRYQDTRDYYRQLDYENDLRDREFYRDQDRHYEDFREDMEFERRRREEDSDRGWEAFRDGDIPGAIRNIAGPDAALRFLDLKAEPEPSADVERKFVTHVFVSELTQLDANVLGAPAGTRFEVSRIDDDGDAVVTASLGDQTELFWVRKSLVGQLGPVNWAAPSVSVLISKIFLAQLLHHRD